MSTRDYGIYKIGVGGIASWVGKQGNENVSTSDIIWPTYGKWGGPEWSNNHRVSKFDTINWDDLPCMNENITVAGADPDKCYSLIDAICKRHDWEYELAEHNTAGQEVWLEMKADTQLLIDINTHLLGGTYTFETGVGSIEASDIAIGNYTTLTESYTSTSLDIAELQYAAEASALFTLKLVPDTLCVTKQAVVDTCTSIWDYVTDVLGITDDKITTTDSNQTFTTQKTGNGDFEYACYVKGDTANENACALDTGTYKVYDMGDITFGDGSVAADNTFVYEGDGKITINGGTGNDKITMGKNDDPTYYTLAGGAGDDSYFLTDGDSFIINDSGENQIYKEDANGGYFSIGDLYKDATDANWHSADGSEQFLQATDTIVFEDGSTVKLDNFQSGDFGINLINEPTTPTIANTILGDQNPENYNDVLYSTAANDSINGGVGNDTILGSDFLGGGNYANDGNDWFSGGSGNDLLQGGKVSGDMIIEGGADSDRVFGANGNDKVFGESYGEMETLIADGETATSINERGDFVSGGKGNDFVYGANRNDLLFGGEGNDLIVGGGGDDAIFGDRDFSTSTSDWSFTITQGVNVFINNASAYETNFAGDDVIYAGAGNDFVYAGGGDDEVYMGEGDDTAIGEGGNDFIEGGIVIQLRDKFKYRNVWRSIAQRENLRRTA
jgi:Ca2+-binding RTX toxin-like protein